MTPTPDVVPACACLAEPLGAGNSVGALVRRLRLAADLTLEGLAEASGISDRALSDIERGVARGPQHRTVVALARALDLPDGDRAALLQAARAGRRRPSSPFPLPPPRDLPDFVGRGAELARTTAALTGPGSPVVVVTGPPGYGKTSLAARVARRLSDAFPEQLFVDLGGTAASPPSTPVIAARVLRGLTGRDGGPDGAPEQLRSVLADRSLLLVLDDAAAESQVRALLPAAGRTAVLVTSRRPLAGLDAAERIRVDRLPPEDARRLLAAILRADESGGAGLARLAELCDGVPLALRIAGNRLASRPGWTVAELTRRMAPADRRLDALTAGDLGMRAAVRSSVAQLRPAARRLFGRLALVDGGTFDAGLAAGLLEEPLARTEDVLDELVDRGLVQPVPGDRFAVPDLLRLYALGELPASDPPGSARNRAPRREEAHGPRAARRGRHRRAAAGRPSHCHLAAGDRPTR